MMILYHLEQPDTITKFTVLECRFVPKEVGGRVKVSLNLYRTVSKFCPLNVQSPVFLINKKRKFVKNQPFCSYFCQNWCINASLDDVLK